MPILPQEIATASFSRIPAEGYDPSEVQAFLREIAADYAGVMEKLVRVSEGVPKLDVGQEVNAVLQAAEQSANAVRQRTSNGSRGYPEGCDREGPIACHRGC
jgi:DivIVA domain-containing protein